MKRKIKKEQIEDIIKEYQFLKSCEKVCTKYKVDRTSIYRILKNNNIKLEPSGGRSFYSLNENFFENIDTENKAYWLGFIAADGWINKPKNKKNFVFGIAISNKDRYHLEKFINDINWGGKLKYKNNFVRIDISRNIFSKNLIDNGIVENKTYCMKLPSLNEDLMRHFIRGYFDGDGCWTVYKNRVMFELIGTESFTDSLQNILIKNLNLSKTKRPFTGKNKIAKIIRYCGNNNCKKIFDYLYKNSTIFLERKKYKVKHILDEYESK